MNLYPYRQDLKKRIELLVTTAMDVRDKLWEVQISSGDLGQSGAISQQRSRDIIRETETETETESSGNGNGNNTGKTLKETVMLFRCHHSLGDAVSLVAALGDLLDEAEEIQAKIRFEIQKRKNKHQGALKKLWRFLQKMIWFLFGSIQALQRQGYLMWTTAQNPFLAVLNKSNKDGLELAALGRSVSWCDVAGVDEVKKVAKIIGGPRATVNDVFVSCVTAAVARQLAEHRKRRSSSDNNYNNGNGDGDEVQMQMQMQKLMNVVIPAHLTGGILPPGRGVGNLIGAFVAQVPGEMDANTLPSERLQLVHASLDKVKRSPAPVLGYLIAKFTSQWLPESWAVGLFRRSSANAAVAITNSRGYEEKVHINGRTVESMVGFIPLPPGLPVGVVVQSYGSVISLTVNAEKWAVPDADKFLSWVLEEYKLLCKEASLKSQS